MHVTNDLSAPPSARQITGAAPRQRQHPLCAYDATLGGSHRSPQCAEVRTTRDIAGFELGARPPNNLVPFYERFEVVETFSETLAIHALDDERISDLAEHAARQFVVERRGQACSIAFWGELPASAPR